MTQEEKQLLVKDLCARLPYNVRCLHKEDNGEDYIDTIIGFDGCRFEIEEQFYDVEDIKPYLRSMSSMTEEEREEYFGNRMTSWAQNEFGETYSEAVMQYRIDFLLEHHFDYRDLIEKGLALEAKEGMYKF